MNYEQLVEFRRNKISQMVRACNRYETTSEQRTAGLRLLKGLSFCCAHIQTSGFVRLPIPDLFVEGEERLSARDVFILFDKLFSQFFDNVYRQQTLDYGIVLERILQEELTLSRQLNQEMIDHLPAPTVMVGRAPGNHEPLPHIDDINSLASEITRDTTLQVSFKSRINWPVISTEAIRSKFYDAVQEVNGRLEIVARDINYTEVVGAFSEAIARSMAVPPETLRGAFNSFSEAVDRFQDAVAREQLGLNSNQDEAFRQTSRTYTPPEHIAKFATENGWTDLHWFGGQWMGFPPNAVMPVSVTYFIEKSKRNGD